MYNLVLLDADRTIFDYDKAEEVALKEALIKFGYEGDLDEIRGKYREINSKMWLELEKGIITKDKLRTERFIRLFSAYGLKHDAEEFSDCYLEGLGRGSHLIEGAHEICKYLSEKYTVVILTNGMKEVQLSRLEGSTVKEYIHDIVVSEEVGVNKPDPYIFEYTMKKMNHTNKERVIIIGDSLTSDIQGGVNYGIDTCWVNLENDENKSDLNPTYSINALCQLRDVL